ncbi:unnamed protein product [Caenorhabditis auriculariae]|uniref:Ground-like domain-containing protein n=1 Tax=Caenorhabditis auriculariae TaxID=2777116 RepID=A0A8S1HBQ1_9PELO|nr:unnamed protein product [Caenorhabditis auriculariae]
MKSVCVFFFFEFLCYGSLAAPLRTVLCCCGCESEVCPIVGASCDEPRQPCDPSSVDILLCSELERLAGATRENSAQNESSISMEHLKIDQRPMEDFSDIDSAAIENEYFLPDQLSVQQNEENDIPPALLIRDFNETSSVQSPSFYRQSVEDDYIEYYHQQLNKLHGMIDEMAKMMKMMRKVVGKRRLNEEESSEVDETVETAAEVFKRRKIRSRRSNKSNCNDKKLGELIEKNIKKDAKASKRAIQKAAAEEFGGQFNVVCSPCEFTFVVNSQKFCDGFKNEVACFAFLQPSSSSDS